MSAFDTYSFVLSLIVFLLLTAIFTFFTVYYVRVTIRLIRLGAEDEKIKTEYQKTQSVSKTNKALSILDKVFSLVVCALLIVAFGVSSCVNIESKKAVKNVPVIQVVQTSSMATRYEKNEYLFKNNITDQIQAFDLVRIHKLPKEEDLKLYDIVVYEVDGTLVIHRIVGIEEPNDKHSERYFVLQGDAVHVRDKFPVKYSQMKGIYRGERLPMVGSFVMFMQSPAGYLCIILVLFVLIAVPIVENKIKKIKAKRLVEIGFITSMGEIVNRTNVSEELVESANGVDDESATALDVSESVTNYDATESATTNENAVQCEEMVVKKWYEDLIGKTFLQKHSQASSIIISRYTEILEYLYKIKDLREWEGKSFQTFRKGRTAIARILYKGKSLFVNLALNPKEFENTKYVFKDVSHLKTYKDYSMRVKLSSDRQVKWTKELIDVIVKNNNLYTYDETKLWEIKGKDRVFEEELGATENQQELTSTVNENDVQCEEKTAKKWYEKLNGQSAKTFRQKHGEASQEIINRYNEVVKHLYKVKGLRVWEATANETYKKGRLPIAKISFKRKSLYVNLALNPSEFESTKYVYKDLSSVKAYKDYPMQVKLSSDRQAKWVNELINIIAEKNGLYMYAISKLITIKGDSKTFEEKLKGLSSEKVARYDKIVEFLSSVSGLKAKNSSKHVTYKLGLKPIVKLKIIGKTLNAYINLLPRKYKNTKYKFIDVSSKKSCQNYPMRVKVSSDRQAKWVIELIEKALQK